MPTIPTNYYLAGLDLLKVARNYRQTVNDGTDVRMGNRVAAVEALAHALNRCLAHLPRILFSKAQPYGNVDNVGSDPLYVYTYDDSVTNARDVVTRVLAVPRTAGANDCYGGRYTGAAVTDKTSVHNNTVGAVDLFEDTFGDTYNHVRGAAAAAEIEEAFSTFNGFTALDVVVQEKPLSQLDTALHDAVDPSTAKKGDEVLADILEDIRDKFHTLRTTGTPRCFGWAAQKQAGAWYTPASTDQTAIVVANTTQVNVIDQAVVARTATSPGVSCHVQYAGWGAQDENNGELIKCYCRVFGSVVNGAIDGKVRFHGPNFAAGGGANNFTDITITNGVAEAWYGDSTNFVYLDSTMPDTDVTVNRNKVDIFGWIPGLTTEIMYLYGLGGWQHAPPY